MSKALSASGPLSDVSESLPKLLIFEHPEFRATLLKQKLS